MRLSLLEGAFAVCRMDADASVPAWAMRGEFFTVSRTHDELSLVCEQGFVPDSVKAEKNWRAFKVQGPLDFGLTGILASIAAPLAAAKVSIFAISTFDTDYVLVKETDRERAVVTLRNAGFEVLLSA